MAGAVQGHALPLTTRGLGTQHLFLRSHISPGLHTGCSRGGEGVQGWAAVWHIHGGSRGVALPRPRRRKPGRQQGGVMEGGSPHLDDNLHAALGVLVPLLALGALGRDALALLGDGGEEEALLALHRSREGRR
jgi:hypothetical protein